MSCDFQREYSLSTELCDDRNRLVSEIAFHPDIFCRNPCNQQWYVPYFLRLLFGDPKNCESLQCRTGHNLCRKIAPDCRHRENSKHSNAHKPKKHPSTCSVSHRPQQIPWGLRPCQTDLLV